jgi:hypothetical protein
LRPRITCRKRAVRAGRPAYYPRLSPDLDQAAPIQHRRGLRASACVSTTARKMRRNERGRHLLYWLLLLASRTNFIHCSASFSHVSLSGVLIAFSAYGGIPRPRRGTHLHQASYCFAGDAGSVGAGAGDGFAGFAFFFFCAAGLSFRCSTPWQAVSCSVLVRRMYPCSVMQGLPPDVPATIADALVRLDDAPGLVAIAS